MKIIDAEVFEDECGKRFTTRIAPREINHRKNLKKEEFNLREALLDSQKNLALEKKVKELKDSIDEDLIATGSDNFSDKISNQALFIYLSKYFYKNNYYKFKQKKLKKKFIASTKWLRPKYIKIYKSFKKEANQFANADNVYEQFRKKSNT